MEASEPKWINPVLKTNGVNSLRLRRIQLIQSNNYKNSYVSNHVSHYFEIHIASDFILYWLKENKYNFISIVFILIFFITPFKLFYKVLIKNYLMIIIQSNVVYFFIWWYWNTWIFKDYAVIEGSNDICHKWYNKYISLLAKGNGAFIFINIIISYI